MVANRDKSLSLAIDDVVVTINSDEKIMKCLLQSVSSILTMKVEDVTPEIALILVTRFPPSPAWKDTRIGDIDVTQFKSSGYVNRLFLVATKKNIIPKIVIIRLYGGKPPFYMSKDEMAKKSFLITEAEEALVFHEQSRKGDGPQLYGIFPGGRIEEFIPSHTLTFQEACDPVISRDVARALARFHSNNLPLAKDRLPRLFQKNKINRELYSHPNVKALGIDFDSILNHDWDKETEWILSTFEKVNSRHTLVSFDVNYANVLVRENAKPDQLQVVMVDYEFTHYGPRGSDIGGHFAFRTLDQKGEKSKASGYPFPSLEERKVFCQEYLEEWKKVSPEKFDPDWDTVDNLIKESTVGAAAMCLFMVNFFIGDVGKSDNGNINEGMAQDPVLFTMLPSIVEMYFRQKKVCQNDFGL